MSRLKERVAAILEIPSAPGDKLGRAFDSFITALIVLNAAAVVLETVGDLNARFDPWFAAFEWASLAIFGAEYVLRLWTCTTQPAFRHPVTGRLRFALTPMAVVDLVAILPALVSFVDLRMLRVLRLFRLLKLGRYSESLQILGRVLATRSRELVMSSFVVVIALVLLSSFVYYAEREAQPEAFSSIPAAMWWGIVTLTTVGFGDVVPVTAAGKVLGGITALLGVGVLALPVGILASGFVQEIERRHKRETERAPAPCPHCGKDVHAAPSAAGDATAGEVTVRRL
jgi:voltage-gated potassium channel